MGWRIFRNYLIYSLIFIVPFVAGVVFAWWPVVALAALLGLSFALLPAQMAAHPWLDSDGPPQSPTAVRSRCLGGGYGGPYW